MISVNGTLCIQIAAFIVAWRFLDRFLFKPLVAAVHQDVAVQEQLEVSLEKVKKEKAVRERYKQERWFEYQMLFARSTPPVLTSQPTCSLGQAKNVFRYLTDVEKQKLQDETVQQLAARIRHEF